MAQKPTIAIDITRRRLRAVEASIAPKGLRIERVLTAEIPDRFDPADVAAVGAWAGAALSRAGFSRGRATIATSRDQVSLKRITLPTSDAHELPDMVRLAMQRELPFDPAEAVIDFVPAQCAPGSGKTTVLAAAMPRSLVDRAQSFAEAAGLRAARISLRCMGVAALTRDRFDDRASASSAWLGVDVTGEGVEVSVLTDDGVRFSRAAELPAATAELEFADAVLTETKRSWMSYRIVEDAPAIVGGAVFGERRIAALMCDAVSELVGAKVTSFDSHARIAATHHDLQSAWPLAGLLLESLTGDASFDFAHPRRPPDLRARLRQRALAIAGAALVVLTALSALAFANIQSLSNTREGLADQVGSEAGDFYRYERDHARQQHLDQWLSTRIDWLGHLHAVQSLLPGPDQLVLDDWSGSLRDPRIEFDAKAEGSARWQTPLEITIALTGEARTQSMIDRLRESFVESREYIAVPVGPDSQDGRRYPHPFKLTLRTDRPQPDERSLAGKEENEERQANETSRHPGAGAGVTEETAAATPDGDARGRGDEGS